MTTFTVYLFVLFLVALYIEIYFLGIAFWILFIFCASRESWAVRTFVYANFVQSRAIWSFGQQNDVCSKNCCFLFSSINFGNGTQKHLLLKHMLLFCLFEGSNAFAFFCWVRWFYRWYFSILKDPAGGFWIFRFFIMQLKSENFNYLISKIDWVFTGLNGSRIENLLKIYGQLGLSEVKIFRLRP